MSCTYPASSSGSIRGAVHPRPLAVALCIAATALAAAAPASAQFGAHYTVNSTADLPDGDPTDGACATSPPGPPVCTLRAAVMEANGHAGQDTITIPAGTYVLTRVGYDADGVAGDLDVTDDVIIQTSGGSVVVDANGAVTFDRAFEVHNGLFAMTGVTVKNGATPGYGGGIAARGSLVLTNVRVRDNTAEQGGGGIYVTGVLAHVYSSTVSGNVTHGIGGGLYVRTDNGPFPELIVDGSLITDNHAVGVFAFGGGLSAYGTTSIVRDTTIQGNSSDGNGGGLHYSGAFGGLSLQVFDSVVDTNIAAAAGGGMFLYGTTSISGTLVTANSGVSGGGIYANFGSHVLTDVEVSNNSAGVSGGGVEARDGNLTINRSWVEGNTAVSYGGGLAHGGSGTIRLTVTDSSVLGNFAPDGGGIWTAVNLEVMASALYHNHGTRGGGVFVSGGVAAIDDSAVSGNSAGGNGGGVYAGPSTTLHMNSATVVSNRARASFPSPGSGGGAWIDGTATATASSSVLAFNRNSDALTGLSDCAGTLASQGYNFIASNSGCTVTGVSTGNHVGGPYPSNIDPGLGPLEVLYDPLAGQTPDANPKAGNVPLAGSPLINAGPPGGCQAANGAYFLWDEVGQFRGLGGLCDIGAVEYGARPLFIFSNGFENGSTSAWSSSTP